MQPGDLISGKYRLLRRLGEGGMGAVWAARNELTDRDFALKSLLPDLAQNPEALQRFFREARACGQIKHPAVVDVYDMGQAEDGSPYLVMELLEGEGFDDRLARSGRFRPAEAAAWIAFISRGLEEAHVRGLVHRDLKPGNVFFALDDRGDVIPKVLDFGISKATAGSDDFVKTSTGAVLGSPAYMSPEQASGEADIDARSDIWSLGVILYEAVTGELPFDAANYNALMVAIITQPHRPVTAVNPSVPAELATIIDHALQKERSKRIATARELAERLEAFAARHSDGSAAMPLHQPRMTSVMPPRMLPAASGAAITQSTWSGRRTGAGRRSPLFTVGVAAFGAALLLAGTAAFYQLRPPAAAVAGRSAAAFAASLSRVQRELERLRAEAEAEKARAAQAAEKPVVLAPSDLPTVKKPAGATTPKPPKGSGNDPHGGVDSAGF